MKLLLRALLLILAGLLFFFMADIVAVWAPDKPLAQLQTRWALPPSQFVAVGDLRVHMRDEGPRDDPAPIVLLHGTADSLFTWDGWAAQLRGQRRVIRVDLPGFGLTGPSPRCLTSCSCPPWCWAETRWAVRLPGAPRWRCHSGCGN